MNASKELYQWLPADERFEDYAREHPYIIVKRKNCGRIFVAKKVILYPLDIVIEDSDGCRFDSYGYIEHEDGSRTEMLEQFEKDYEYLPPTAPEVLELPDCEGWWWVWLESFSYWIPIYIKMEEGEPTNQRVVVHKGHYVNASLYPKPNFNPVTGEKL